MYYSSVQHNFLRFSNLFFKLAQISFEEPELSWVPQKFKEAKPFKEYPKQKVEKLFAQYGLHDFREEIKISSREESAEKLLAKMKANLISLVKEIHKNIYLIFNEDNGIELNTLESKLIELRRFLASVASGMYIDNYFFEGQLKLPRNWNPPKALEWKPFLENSSAIKSYNNLLEKVKNTININIDQFLIEPTPEFKEYSSAPKSKNQTIVFSTKINDLIGSSSRGIRSCISLFDCNEEMVDFTENSAKVVGSVLSKYIGVIYLTSGENYLDRGERMFYRAMVRIVYDLSTEEPAIVLDKIYPKQNKEIENLFLEKLRKNSSIQVMTIQEAENKKTLYNPEDDEEEIPEIYKSYKDTALSPSLNKTLQNLSSRYYGDRLEAVKVLPIKYIRKLSDDPDEQVRAGVAKRLPDDEILVFLSDPTQEVQRVLVKRFGKNHPEYFYNSEDNFIVEQVIKQLSLEEKIKIYTEDRDEMSVEFALYLIEIGLPNGEAYEIDEKLNRKTIVSRWE